MTEGRQSSRSISMLHSMLNRVKSSDRPQVSSHVTAQYHGYSKDTNLSDSVFIPESDKPAWKVTGSHLSENSVKPDVDSEYFTQRSVFQESSSTSNTFLKSGRPSNLLHSLTRDTRQDSQLNETNALWEEVKEEQTSQAESHFSILKSSPPHGPFTHDPTRPSLSHSEPRFIKGPTVPMDYEIMTQPYRSENRVSHCVHSAVCFLHLLQSVDISVNFGQLWNLKMQLNCFLISTASSQINKSLIWLRLLRKQSLHPCPLNCGISTRHMSHYKGKYLYIPSVPKAETDT